MLGNHWGRSLALGLTAAALVAGCTGAVPTTVSSTVASTAAAESEVTTTAGSACADVVNVTVTAEEERTYRFDVTVRSPDTGWDKYADLWEVRDPEGAVLGQRVLAHPHVDEQPFTRSQSGIGVPSGVNTVMVLARDSVAGFCGEIYEVEVP